MAELRTALSLFRRPSDRHCWMMTAAAVPAMQALLVIDLQNEFLHDDGRFPAHADSRVFMDNLAAFVPAFRDAGGLIVWVVAEYGAALGDAVLPIAAHDGTDSDLAIGDTHRGSTPCCVAGSHGALMHAAAERLVQAGVDVRLTKTWYSAFRDTGLAELLHGRDVHDVLVCGLLSNVCVLATANDALRHGFSTTVLTDCLGWRRLKSHARALDVIRGLGVRLGTSTEVLAHHVAADTEGIDSDATTAKYRA